MIAVFLGTAYVALLLGKAALAVRAARRSPQPALGNAIDFSDVVVAQPILSGDPRLSETLEDNVLALPSAHFIWLVDSDDPEAQAICATLSARHPAVRIDTLVSPPPPDGCNPKLLKLEGARSILGDRTLVVLDDDTRLPAASLSAILTGLEGSEVSTGLPAYIDDDSWPARLLAQFVNNNAALTYLPLLNFSPPPTINGMTYAIRGRTLERLGGFAPLIGHLTDDLAVARVVLASGGRISQTALPQWVQTTVPDGSRYIRLMHRWFLFARLLLQHQPRHLQVVIAFLYAVPPILLWAVIIATVAQSSGVALATLAIVLVVRSLTLVALQRRIYGRSLHRPILSLASELLQPFHLVHAALVRTIVWRTRRYVVTDIDSFRSA